MVQDGPKGIHVLGRQQSPGAVPPLQPQKRWGFSLPTAPRHQLCSVGLGFCLTKADNEHASPCTILLNEQGPWDPVGAKSRPLEITEPQWGEKSHTLSLTDVVN